MTSTWQKPGSESPINRDDGVESLEYRPIMLSEDTTREEVGSNGEDEDLSKIDEDQQQEIGTSSCKSSSSSVRIDEVRSSDHTKRGRLSGASQHRIRRWEVINLP